MPPFLPRKRLRSPTPEAGPSKPPTKDGGKAKATPTIPRKPTLFDDLDAGTGRKRTAEDSKILLEGLGASTDDESSLSSLSDEEFENVPNAKRQKTSNEVDEGDEDEDEDEDMEFEDVQTHAAPSTSAPMPSGDLELTLTKDTRVDITNPFGTKKGPSKIERGIRISTHQIHVQMLMFHNAIRNSWLCDKELQNILVKQLPPGMARRVEKWRYDSGLQPNHEVVKGKGKKKAQNGKKADPRSQRDWGEPAEILTEILAEGQVNMGARDPLNNLLESLANYWRQRFRITAPGLRKLGYMSLQRLDEEIKSFKQDKYDPERHGERIKNLDEFRECAKSLEGSRDVCAQLFTALLRGLGIEARLVANLQPLGFGWSHNEEATEKNPRILKRPKLTASDEGSSDDDSSSGEESNSKSVKHGKPKVNFKGKAKVVPQSTKTRQTNGTNKDVPIDLSDLEDPASDDDSVIDVTPVKPRTKPSLPYDKDLLFPHYWTEVLSSVTNTYTPVDAVVLRVVATSKSILEKFETRGAKSEKSKQVTAYIIAHNSDGTAKDVTTRYLKRHVWPGRTKGNRFPKEKIPIYNKHGKVKRYEEKDWFKTVMSGYVRGSKKCPRTEIDDHEEATDLKPVKAEKKEVEEGKETLQYYKSSPDFVLERHLKREEALIPHAKHVKMFAVKGKGEETTEEKVFRRKDVVSCKSMETWHKEGRAPKPGEEPLKRVPYRAATTNRRRELAEAEHASGEKVLQGLYSRAQTDWIIPPPIENGIIPKNSFGNIDLYVESMLPQGAVHIPYRGTVKICKRLNIDYAEAVTGFEFGHRMAVPVITGVVVAEEHYDAVMEEFEKDEAERVRKEDEKRRKAAIHMWRKMLMGMRIIERVREEYGDFADAEVDALNPWTNTKDDRDSEAQKRIMDQRDEDMAGGFLPEGFDAEEPHQERPASFYPVAHEDDEEDDGGGFVVERDDEPTKPTTGNASTMLQLSPAGTKILDVVNQEGHPEDEDITSVVEAPVSRQRGRPAAASKTVNPKPAAVAKRKAPSNHPVPGTKGKRKVEIQDTDDDEEEEGEDEDDELSLTELESELESESEAEEPPKQAKPKKKAPARKPTLPAKAAQTTPRRTPRRTAARKSETALRSHYFDHDDDDGDEDDED